MFPSWKRRIHTHPLARLYRDSKGASEPAYTRLFPTFFSHYDSGVRGRSHRGFPRMARRRQVNLIGWSGRNGAHLRGSGRLCPQTEIRNCPSLNPTNTTKAPCQIWGCSNKKCLDTHVTLYARPSVGVTSACSELGGEQCKDSLDRYLGMLSLCPEKVGMSVSDSTPPLKPFPSPAAPTNFTLSSTMQASGPAGASPSSSSDSKLDRSAPEI